MVGSHADVRSSILQGASTFSGAREGGCGLPSDCVFVEGLPSAGCLFQFAGTG